MLKLYWNIDIQIKKMKLHIAIYYGNIYRICIQNKEFITCDSARKAV